MNAKFYKKYLRKNIMIQKIFSLAFSIHDLKNEFILEIFFIY